MKNNIPSDVIVSMNRDSQSSPIFPTVRANLARNTPSIGSYAANFALGLGRLKNDEEFILRAFQGLSH